MKSKALLFLTPIIALVCSLFSTSCIATKADLEELRVGVEQRDAEIVDARRAHAAGEITADEMAARLLESNRALEEKIDSKIDEVQDRATGLIAGAPTTGNWLADLLIMIGSTVATSVVATNKARDAARIRRGEVVRAVEPVAVRDAHLSHVKVAGVVTPEK